MQRNSLKSRVEKMLVQGPQLGPVLFGALILRILAALIVQFFASKQGKICLFGDTPIYWQYARAIARGTTYVVYQWDVPHYALRTPGYPAWLAGWFTLFGEWALPIRFGQAILGCFGAYWVYKIALELGFSDASARWSGALLAIDPFQVLSCVLLLTESIFTPLLALFVLALITILKAMNAGSLDRHNSFCCIVLGLLQAYLSLVRPAWIYFLCVPLVSFFIFPGRSSGFKKQLTAACFFLVGWSLLMAPWGLRNRQVTGRAALGGTWGGASLYDGVRPGATGSSDMSFVADPEFRSLAETEQDDLWKQLSYREIRSDFRRIARLAWVKQARFWSAWPNDSAKVPAIVKVGCAVVVWPVWLLILSSAWRGRYNLLLFIVLSPLIYTAALHLLFVGSSRYRLAVILPSMALAGEGIKHFFTRRFQLGKKADLS